MRPWCRARVCCRRQCRPALSEPMVLLLPCNGLSNSTPSLSLQSIDYGSTVSHGSLCRWGEEMSRQAQSQLRCLQEALAERWVGMDGACQILQRGAHLQCQRSLGDQLPRTSPRDMHAKQHTAFLIGYHQRL